MSSESALGLYLHIPFCRHRCAYCDFNTYSTVGELTGDYVDALLEEVREVAGDSRRPASTVYFGGGTPSLLPAESVRLLVDKVKGSFELDGKAEITLEANPETLSLEYLSAVRRAGVNRLSLGAQSANAAELALLEREHDFETVVRAVEDARAAGFENINLDLIYGLPGQSLASWERSLSAVLVRKPNHLSLYCLTIEPGTPMNRWLASGRFAAPDPDLAAEQYELASKTLKREGFQHYEISNWSHPGLACQHNLIYWRNGAYLGLGAGAHGHAAGYRYSVVRQPRVYIRRMRSSDPGRFPWSAALAEKRLLSRSDRMADTIITQLRLLNEGINLDAFNEQFGLDLFSAYPGVAEQLIDWGLLQQSAGRLLLSERGQFLSNQVFYRFM
ncbi:MAG: radical SAM family heme chaperone HemW [Chloroflexota bacterium]|nr:MAG: radical SAM family heme chaperone HemW [Chloroflexota bacterium]